MAIQSTVMRTHRGRSCTLSLQRVPTGIRSQVYTIGSLVSDLWTEAELEFPQFPACGWKGPPDLLSLSNHRT